MNTFSSRRNAKRGHLARRLIECQVRWSTDIDRWLPEAFHLDGNRDFLDQLVPLHVQPGMVLYDLGGGKNPAISRDKKTALGLKVVGVDVDPVELASAPEGIFDECICADVTGYSGRGDADLVVCQSLMEHVQDTERAMRTIAGILKPEGRALIFTPSRNAIYARLNLLLPERLKRNIMAAIFPEMRRDHGFPAIYDRCTPRQFEQMAHKCGLAVDECRLYFQSSYFRFCFPLFVLWRLWLLLFRWAAGSQAAETFALVLRKEEG